MQPSPHRTDWVDYAKGICIIMVVMMHSTLGVEEALNGEGLLHYIVAWARPFRMPDFFLIAGLFLSRSISQSWSRYIDRKLVHFLYFYIIWMLIQLLSKQGYLLVSNPDVFIKELSLAFLEPYTTLWFIYILPIMFVVTKLISDIPKWVVLSVAILAEFLFRLFDWHTNWIILDEFPLRFVYFYAGYIFAPLIFKWVDWVQRHPSKSFMLLMIWGVMNAIAVFTPASVLPLAIVPQHMLTPQLSEFGSLAFYPGVSLFFGTAGLLAVLALAGLFASRGYLGFLHYLGSHSIIVYLSFFIPMALTRILCVKLGFVNVTGVSLLVTCAGVVAPLIFYRIVCKTYFKFLYERPQQFRVA